MPKVEVYLYATLRRYWPELGHGQAAHLDLPSGASLADLLSRLGIPREEMKQSFVNGLQQDASYVLQEGDRVAIFPPIAGGRRS